MYTVALQTIEPMTALTCEHTGAYHRIREAFERLDAQLRRHALLGRVAMTLGIYYDNPALVPEDRLRSRAGVVLGPGEIPPVPLDQTEIAGGLYGILRHRGAYSDLPQKYAWLYGEWLPQSGQRTSDEPSFEVYLNMPGAVPGSDLVTDIYLPLR